MTGDPDLTWTLLQNLRACSRHVQRGVDNHPLDELDVGLLALASRSGTAVRPTDVAQALEATAPTITRHVRKLADGGLLDIEPDPADGRSYRLSITDAGRAFFQRFRDDLIDTFTPVLTGWERPDVVALADLLGRLNVAMTEAREQRSSSTRKNWWKNENQTPSD